MSISESLVGTLSYRQISLPACDFFRVQQSEHWQVSICTSILPVLGEQVLIVKSLDSNHDVVAAPFVRYITDIISRIPLFLDDTVLVIELSKSNTLAI